MQYENRDDFRGMRGDCRRVGAPGRERRAQRSRGFGPGEFGPGGFGGRGFGPDGPRGGGRGHRHGPRGRGRGRRGDARAAILLLLREEPMHGYQLIQQIGERSGGAWRPSPGSVYPALSQLEDEGLIVVEAVSGRKTARLTETGEEYLREHTAELGDPFADYRSAEGPETRDLRELSGQLMGAVRQVASAGTPDQIARAGELLAEARRAIYRLLAEDDGPRPAGESRDGESGSGGGDAAEG